ncbi:MICOS complex subunit mic25a isoform X1 [Triplophysa rosa]|uniref:Coiled-coil-helix-coiled-coil-helix domain-containing protein 6 n=1 Tax=Triplophysa rosa TaxID=992332 RepID=A0A9W7WBV0_TRIRA|nr:MICOS complex subunit mic25a isoform X1 [Triplophysa rosa]XP_057175918.1 MICOS complex subunit mic25a isoform X1 [Triplophysa rosa]KAI7794356.1 putative coiled-coil-helix-coiled-coil-helix domain-containing protein 6 [Triplophysa rosa]
MGSGESTSRRVSFGLDEDDRVRILRGVKLSEDVLQRMRNQSQTPDPRPPAQTKENLGQETRTSSASDAPPPESQPRTFADSKEELRKRYEQQQAIIQEELARVAHNEREAARQDITRAVQRERAQTRQESEKAKQLPASELDAWGKQLDKKEAELKALNAFYREQIAQLEKKNEERFKMSAEQFHTAAARSEANIKPRNMEPVCTNLQAQILNCYRENRTQTLQCSDLAKEYMQCINAAKKNLLVNHG